MKPPRLILVPGIGNAASIWRPVERGLKAAGVDCTAVELAGFGEDRSTIWLTSPELATRRFTEAIHNAVGDGPAIVVGHSLGGMLSLRHHRRIGASAYIGICVTQRDLVRRLARPFRIPTMVDLRALRLFVGSSFTLPSFAISAIARSSQLQRAFLGDLLARDSEVEEETLRDALAGVGSLSALAPLLHPDSARDLQWWIDPPPVLALISAEEDAFVSKRDQEFAAEHLSANLVYEGVLKHSGHWAMVNDPPQLVAEILRALDAFSATTS